LGGKPGILSSRYGQEGDRVLSDDEKNTLLLEELSKFEKDGAVSNGAVSEDAPLTAYNCRFVCCMVLVAGRDRFFSAQETLHGVIDGRRAGDGGFGYDPIVYLPPHGRTVAELDTRLKNKISHRRRAAEKLVPFLRCL
jgi:XTP/dITP diphosphohydrolase